MASARHSKQECPLCRAPFPKEVQLVRALLVNLDLICFLNRSPAQVMGAARWGLQSAGSMRVLADTKKNMLRQGFEAHLVCL